MAGLTIRIRLRAPDQAKSMLALVSRLNCDGELESSRLGIERIGCGDVKLLMETLLTCGVL